MIDSLLCCFSVGLFTTRNEMIFSFPQLSDRNKTLPLRGSGITEIVYNLSVKRSLTRGIINEEGEEGDHEVLRGGAYDCSATRLLLKATSISDGPVGLRVWR